MSSGNDVSNNDNNNEHSSPVHTAPEDNNTPPLPARPASAAPLAQTLNSEKDRDKDNDDRVQQHKGNSLPAAAINRPELGSAGVGPADKVHT